MRILIVDDNTTMRRILRKQLAEIGHENVDETESGSHALKMLRSSAYDLVISDWHMEPMTGYELLKHIRADEKLRRLSVIIITAEGKTDNVIAAHKAGVNNYLVKPFTPQTLQAKIDTLLPAHPGHVA